MVVIFTYMRASKKNTAKKKVTSKTTTLNSVVVCVSLIFSQKTAQAFFVGGDTIKWEMDLPSECSHALVTRKTTETHFPSEEEAKFYACINDLSKKCATCITEMEQDLKSLKLDSEQSRKDIEDEYDRLLQALDDRRVKLLGELELAENAREQELNKMIKELSNYKDNCDNAMKQISFITKTLNLKKKKKNL
ncbi:hypothetical protein RFI_11400 [Reticulomyxa filosa]|uniref:Uncharacterized protein n=1 Tax=Reticulomyxa filosa TaxID=46433 RepID=X6NK51_RETFI|nr:hypothetical protein RFI_11400 [Reticulomyxa filosa]|eukprot:ETO25737.1 hypothetical protein RFI_11400 [Reticulomyxa filosa]